MRKIIILLLTGLSLTIGKALAADTVYNGETVSITWGLSEGEENSKAVLSDRKTIMDFSWNCGGGLGISSNPTRVIHDKTVTVFYPAKITKGSTSGDYASDDYIEFTLTPYDALSFTPTKVKVDAFKIGTDKPMINIYVIDGAGNVHGVAYEEPMARIDNSHSWDESSNNEERVFGITGCASSANTVKVRIYVANCDYNKNVGFANVSIEGTVTGVSHFREEYAVNIASNNYEWGTVKSTKDYVVEENPVTLTATPNRGYRFLGWADADNNYVSTDLAYTFVPEADINLTAVFEPLAVYQVTVSSNIDEAGIVSVTTFEDGIYYEGDIIEISALPNQGYVFTGWSDGLTTWKRETLTLAADIDLTANFENVGEPAVYACWSMSEDTNAEITGEATASFSLSNLYDAGSTVTIDGATMRTFSSSAGYGNVTLTLGVTPAKGQVFVARSIELDVARVGTSGGIFSLSVGGTGIASDVYPGAFISGVDYPHTHYYYNLGQSLEFQTDIPITITMDDLSSVEGKGIAIGNVKVQGYYKTKEIEITIPDMGYAPYSSKYDLGFGSTSITSYIAQVSDDDVMFTQISNTPANTGLLLKGTPGSYMVPVVDTVDEVEDNVLMPMLDGGSIEPEADGMQNMQLQRKTNRLAFFIPESTSTLAANTAFMQIPSSMGIEFVDAPNQLFTLDEDDVSSPSSFAKGATINMKRTINADEWSTICLPFAMTEQQVNDAFGSDVQIAEFDNYVINADKTAITVNFTNANDGMKANCPYIIRTSWDVTAFTADNVNLSPDEENAFVKSEDGKGKFSGTYHAQTIVPENSLFISGNLFWYSKGLTKMKGFRAWFDFDDVLVSAEATPSRVNMKFNDETTGISSMHNSQFVMYHEAYDLQGRRIQRSTLKKGIYVREGKKVVVR